MIFYLRDKYIHISAYMNVNSSANK